MVVTTGTFLGGVIHRGLTQEPAGRVGEKPSLELSRQFRAMSLPLGRLKTGTPARIVSSSIDWAVSISSMATIRRKPFSTLTDRIINRQVACGVTRTTTKTHELIRDNFHQSAMYAGHILGRGPRYCPSIEDKVARFGDRDGTRFSSSPRDWTAIWCIPMGFPHHCPPRSRTPISGPFRVLERAVIRVPGYAIEYDYVDPRALNGDLQLNLPWIVPGRADHGTTGYEKLPLRG